MTDFKLIPDINSNMPDDFLLALFAQMEADGTASQVFLEREITDAEKWLQYIKSPGVHLYILFADDMPVGVCWIDRLQERWGQFHFCLFRQAWGHRSSVPLGKWVLNEILNMKDEHGYLLDMLVGILPSRNKVAMRYVLKCGGQKSGVLPLGVVNGATGQSEEATVITITRETLL